MIASQHGIEQAQDTKAPYDPAAAMTDKRPDAGMRELDHYATKLPKWRYAARQFLIPIVRWETPYLALLQEKLRTRSLDSYFAFTANLGTHTFFMIMLPILFWCGYASLGRAMVRVLAMGVFWSGFVKDLLCLPRPLSPPLHRITMSGSAALEYGFPSTHSTNAVSVALYAVQMLHITENPNNAALHTALQLFFYFYASSIVFGRLYCGMHGFFDVIVGTALGAVLAILELRYGETFHVWLCSGPFYSNPLMITLTVLVLIRIHPEPVDDCPCFDDSVAFAGTVVGIELGSRFFAQSIYADDSISIAFDLEKIGWIKTCIRIVLGILVIFAWRGVMKSVLLKFLPPLFRILERVQLILPRKYFLQASQYTRVPPLRKDDNIIPPAAELPRLFTTLRHPRKRSVSIGPQSVADAYETIAYRNKRRRESVSSANGPESPTPPSPTAAQEYEHEMASPASVARAEAAVDYVETYGVEERESAKVGETREGDEDEDRQIFLRLERPRVRYDVEVVTKLIVYAGIGWWAVEGNPVLFELCGLGMSR